jgi:WD40 repeat protein
MIASGSSDNTVRLWATETGECRAVLSGHTSRIWNVASDAKYAADHSADVSASGLQMISDKAAGFRESYGVSVVTG